MTSPNRRRTASKADARTRVGAARAYLEVADLVLDENADVAMPGVAAGLAVLAGIAASDGISAVRLGEIHRGADHRGAAELLRGATADGSKLKATFLKLIDLKDEAHYGLTLVRNAKPRTQCAGQGCSWTAQSKNSSAEQGRLGRSGGARTAAWSGGADSARRSWDLESTGWPRMTLTSRMGARTAH
jgi:hypothetical protein